MTEYKNTLPIGITYKGAILKDFTVRPLTAGLEMDAADLCLDYGKTTGGAVALARLAVQTEIEGLPPEKLTLTLIRQLDNSDLEAIQEGAKILEKGFTPTPVLVD